MNSPNDSSKKSVFIRINKQEYQAPHLRLNVDAISMEGERPLPNTMVGLQFLKQEQKFPTNEQGVATADVQFKCTEQGIKDKLRAWLESVNGSVISPVVQYDLISPLVERGIAAFQKRLTQQLEQVQQALTNKRAECTQLERGIAVLQQEKNQLFNEAARDIATRDAQVGELRKKLTSTAEELKKSNQILRDLLGPKKPSYELLQKQQDAKRILEGWQDYWENANRYYIQTEKITKRLASQLVEARRMSPIIKKAYTEINEELKVINTQRNLKAEEIRRNYDSKRETPGEANQADDMRREKERDLLLRWVKIFPAELEDYKYQRVKTLRVYAYVERRYGGLFKKDIDEWKADITYNVPQKYEYGYSCYVIDEETGEKRGIRKTLYQQNQHWIAPEALPAYAAYVQDLERKHTEAEAELKRAGEERKKAYEGLQKAEASARAVHVFPDSNSK